MVTPEHDNGILAILTIVECVEQSSYLRIDIGNAGQIGLDGCFPLSVCDEGSQSSHSGRRPRSAKHLGTVLDRRRRPSLATTRSARQSRIDSVSHRHSAQSPSFILESPYSKPSSVIPTHGQAPQAATRNPWTGTVLRGGLGASEPCETFVVPDSGSAASRFTPNEGPSCPKLGPRESCGGWNGQHRATNGSVFRRRASAWSAA